MKKSKKIGGKVIGHGGFGCAFHPNIMCELNEDGKTKKMKPNKKFVSKLMHSEKYFEDEFNDVQMLDKYLSQIPDNEKYFLYKVQKCKPLHISNQDLKGIKECHKISDLSKSEMLNFNTLLVEYGGQTVYDFVEKYHRNRKLMKTVYKVLLNLFEKAIIPLNLIHVYHSDLKLDNLLFLHSNIKIIDFGFVSFFDPVKDNIVPHKFETFPWQFNMPVTVALFDPDISRLITSEFNAGKSFASIGKAIVQYCFDNGRKGHYTSLSEMFDECNKTFKGNFDLFLATTFATVIKHYMVNDIFDSFSYFTEYYSYNVDVIGFMTCVYDFGRYCKNKKKLEKLYFKIAYDCFLEKINKQQLLIDLNSLHLF